MAIDTSASDPIVPPRRDDEGNPLAHTFYRCEQCGLMVFDRGTSEERQIHTPASALCARHVLRLQGS